MENERLEGADSVVCFAGVDWWYHNRGHSECQVMRLLSRQVPVLWVNSIGMRRPMPGKSELPFRRYARKLRSTFKGLKRDECGLWVYSPLFLPAYSASALEFNGRFVAAQVRRLRKKLGMKRPAAWVTIPTAAPIIERMEWSRVAFNRSDDFASFPEVDSELVRSMENRVFDKSDVVFYVNQGLFDQERAQRDSAMFLDHGVDYEHFASVRPLDGSRPPRPRELEGIEGPIVGFYGALDDYTIDLDLMVATARHIAPNTLLVIGPQAMEIGKLLAEPNVRYLGPIPYEQLPQYAAHFDVGIMPWLANDWIEACNPIKLKEYLALGFPIVSTDFSELRKYDGLVHVARDTEGFCAALDAALEEGPREAAKRRAAVEPHTWAAVTERVRSAMDVRGS